jgi:hypothetical protein
MILVLVLLGGCSTWPRELSAPDQSTPEAAIRSLNDAYNRRDVKTVRVLVKPNDPASNAYLAKYEDFVKQGGGHQIDNVEVDIVENSEGFARARMRAQIKIITGTGQTIADSQGGGLYSLVKLQERWYFVGLGQAVPPGWLAPRQ